MPSKKGYVKGTGRSREYTFLLFIPYFFQKVLDEVEGYEIFIKFLPPSASATSLKQFFSEAAEPRMVSILHPRTGTGWVLPPLTNSWITCIT